MDPFANGSFNLNYYATCTDDSDCSEDLTCEGNRCEDNGSEPSRCIVDTECESGQTCENGTCQDSSLPQQCGTDRECLSGERCSNGICVASDAEVDFCQDVLTVPPSGRFSTDSQLGWQAVEPPCAPPTGNPGKDLVFLWQPEASNSYSVRVEGPTPQRDPFHL